MNERTRLLNENNTPVSSSKSVNFRSPSLNERISDDTSSVNSNESEENFNSLSWNNITNRQCMVLCVLLTATLTSSFAVCLFPPFFPKLAEEKGCTSTVYGLIIGTNCLTSFLVTPVIGKHLSKIGIRFALIIGMFIGGVCCLLSGFLEFFTPGWSFVVLSVLIRIVHAAGNALVITATFTYSAMEFQNNVGMVFSLTRTAMNLAQLFGPSIGGAILGLGGFYLPFVVMGFVQITMACVSVPFLPECSCQPRRENKNGSSRKKKVSVMNILFGIPRIWIAFLTFIVATCCNGFLSTHLEPKVLRQFELSPFKVGLLFGLKDGANCIASPIWGVLCDNSRKTTVKPYIIISACLAGASFFLLGASNVVGVVLTPAIPLVIFALSLNGIGIGGEQVAGVIDALHEAVNAGYPNDPAMHGLISGLWSSLSGFGRFVSRGGSGLLVESIGFNKTALVALSMQGFVAVVAIVYMVCYEILLKKNKPVHRWEDVTIIEEGSQDEVVFTESNSPSESVMGRSVHVEVPRSSRSGRRYSAHRSTTARSLPQRRGILTNNNYNQNNVHGANTSSSFSISRSVLGTSLEPY